MSSLDSLNKKCNRKDNSKKPTRTTEDLLKEFGKDSFRANKLLKAIERANLLATSVGIIPVMTSFIIDTGAGIHLKCYAPGLSALS